MALMSLSFAAFNQTKERIKIAKGVLLDYQIDKTITDQTDTLVYFYWGFQNNKYTTITDIGSFMYTEKKDLQLFVDMLKVIAQKEDGASIDITIKGGMFRLYDFSPKSIYVYEKNEKYTIIKKKDALKIALEIEQYIHFLK